ncbi:MAG: methionine--tRNA ligase [Candidatus Paceibacterota bacterium]
MTEKQKTFYITTTLPYVNAELHMGHALEFIRTDAIARYKKLIGYDVFFNTGTDEHGSKIYEKAVEAGMDPQEFVDQGFESFKKSLAIFGVTDDVHFIRTTDLNHIASAQSFWDKVKNNGFIYKKNYQAKYCVGCESEKTDSDLNEKSECPDHPGRPLQIIEEENYFFKYSKFGPKLLEFYKQHPKFVIPEFRFNEVKAFVERGLQDFSISRLKTKMPWGIPVPGDDEHVMYVWFDALTNYINTLGWPDAEGAFKKYWIHGNPTQYCGKDNTRFQSAMWQAMLMAAGVQNSHQIIVNGFVMGEGGVKMSKTLGNVVNPREIVEEYGIDALRYFMLREISSFEDSPFSKDRFKEAYNANLANGLGNLVSRVMTLSEKYINEKITLNHIFNFSTFNENMDSFQINNAMDIIWQQVSALDLFIQTEMPFKVIKIDEEKGRLIISQMVGELYRISIMLEPLLPKTALQIQELIKENKKPETPLFARKD